MFSFRAVKLLYMFWWVHGSIEREHVIYNSNIVMNVCLEHAYCTPEAA